VPITNYFEVLPAVAAVDDPVAAPVIPGFGSSRIYRVGLVLSHMSFLFGPQAPNFSLFTRARQRDIFYLPVKTSKVKYLSRA
jgi:hypothetical protein